MRKAIGFAEVKNLTSRADRESGFSLIEGLIGAALLLVVLIGVLPLFTRAIIDNTAGADYTRVAQYAKSRVEDFAKSRINTAPYIIAPGTTQTVIDEYLDPTTNIWTLVAGAIPTRVQWRRTSTIQAYQYSTPFSIGTPLDGGTAPDFWRIQVVVQNLEGSTGAGAFAGPLMARKGTTVTYLRSF